MGNTRGCVLLACAVLLAGPATASGLKVLGFDDNSCAAWQAAAADPDQRAAQVAWARGFLSGHNYANQRQQDAIYYAKSLPVFFAVVRIQFSESYRVTFWRKSQPRKISQVCNRADNHRCAHPFKYR